MNRIAMVALTAAATLPFTVGCATKNYVRNQTQPVVNKVNELDSMTRKNTNDIRDVDARAQQGIQSVMAKAGQADQKAAQAGQSAQQAQQMATQVSTQAGQITNTVANLDNYKSMAEAQVHFAFNRYNLTRKAKEALDQLGNQFQTAKHYIVVVDGNTDSVGPASYNYVLSQRRADTVIQYLESKYAIPAHQIYVIGLGKDKPADSNRTAKGRAENRRVDVKLMTNMPQASETASNTQQ